MLIFIPTLIICVNSQCEFQQAKTYYTRESECRSQITMQKAVIARIAATDNIKPVIEGTCIVADIALINS